MKKKLCKSNKNRIILGVCGGLAEYFNLDPTIIRIIAVVLGCLKGFGLLAYIIIGLIMPPAEPSQNYEDDDLEHMKSANVDEEWAGRAGSEDGKKSDNSSMHSDEDFDSYFKK